MSLFWICMTIFIPIVYGLASTFKHCPNKAIAGDTNVGEEVKSHAHCAAKCLLDQTCLSYSASSLGNDTDAVTCKLHTTNSKDKGFKLVPTNDDGTLYFEKMSPRIRDDTEKYWCETAKDCSALYDLGARDDGVYLIQVGDEAFSVYCDMAGGGWTLIQRRMTNDISFDRTWAEYKVGFGDLQGDFWLGNDYIHTLTNQDNYHFESVMNQDGGDPIIDYYKTFIIADESNNYMLTINNYTATKSTTSVGPEVWNYYNGMNFTTKDSNNNIMANHNCATGGSAGWWYRNCIVIITNANICTTYAYGCQFRYYSTSNYILGRGSVLKIKRY